MSVLSTTATTGSGSPSDNPGLDYPKSSTMNASPAGISGMDLSPTRRPSNNRLSTGNRKLNELAGAFGHFPGLDASALLSSQGEYK